MILAAICGRAGSGKDTLFSFLREINPSLQREKFAYPLQQIVALLGQFDYSSAQFEDRVWKESAPIDLTNAKQNQPDIYRQITDVLCSPSLVLPDGTEISWDTVYTTLELEFERLFPDDIYSPRQLMQRLGTDLFRQRVHPDIWVACAEQRLRRHRPGSPVVFTDLRFPNELALIRRWGGFVVYLESSASSCNHSSESYYEYLKATANLVFVNDKSLKNLQDFARSLAVVLGLG